MNDKQLHEIDEKTLLGLIDTPVLEGNRIEYKQQLNLASDDAKKKFLASVASFANATGGDMVFGMEAADGRPVALKALQGFNFDQTSLQIRDLVRTGIQPPIYTSECRAIPLSGGGEALVLRIGKTWAGAHMVTYNGDNRFYTRHGGGKRPMDVGEIRSAFTMADTTAERIQRWRLERMAHILADETPCKLGGKAGIVLHLVPLRAFDPSFTANLGRLRDFTPHFRPLYADGWGPHHEFDGYYVADGGVRNEATGYAYAFRNGAMEVLDTAMLDFNGEKRWIPSLAFEQRIVEGMANWLPAMQAVGAEAPVVLMMSLLNAKGYHMAVNPGYGGFGTHPVTRDHLHTSATVLESLSLQAADSNPKQYLAAMLRPHFDAVWNACGYPRSIYYNQAGEWTGNNR